MGQSSGVGQKPCQYFMRPRPRQSIQARIHKVFTMFAPPVEDPGAYALGHV